MNKDMYKKLMSLYKKCREENKTNEMVDVLYTTINKFPEYTDPYIKLSSLLAKYGLLNKADIIIKKMKDKHPDFNISLDAVLFDNYYRHATNIQQGSIKGYFPTPKWDNNKPSLIIFTKRYWLAHTALEISFAKERQKNGWNVTVIGCDGAVQTCDNMTYGQVKPDPIPTHRCDHCSFMLRQLCKRTGVNYLSIREYMQEHKLTINSCKERNYKNLAWFSWIRLTRNLQPNSPDEYSLLHSLVKSCKVLDAFFTDLFLRHKIDEVIMLNGKFFGEALLRMHCRENKVDYLTYEGGQIPDTLIFAKNETAVPYKVKQLWEKYKNIPLTADEEHTIKNYLDKRRKQGGSGKILLYPELQDDSKDIFSKHNLDRHKISNLMFTNVIWDTTVVGEDTIFENILEWINTCIEHYTANFQEQLIIRIHPAEVRLNKKFSTVQRLDQFIFNNYKNLPSNITVIPPEDNTSPYALMDIAQRGLVYTSTTGLEMATRGLPVIVASNAHYANTEFVYTPRDKKQFIELLKTPLEARKDQKIFAMRYAYMLYFRAMVSHEDSIKRINNANYRFIKNLNDIKLLERAGY